MVYMGSKGKLANKLLPIILKGRQYGQWYVEPFVGGANMIVKVGGYRWGNDSQPYLIALFQAIQRGWQPPEHVSKELYTDIKLNKDKYPPELVAFVGFCCSFGGAWFGGYAKNSKGTNYATRGKFMLLKSRPALLGIKFTSMDYTAMDIPPNSVIYCDPPYANTKGYSQGKFDSNKFWEWVRVKVKEGHSVFISEYTAPKDFKEVFSFRVKEGLNSELNGSLIVKTEKLFVHESIYGRVIQK